MHKNATHCREVSGAFLERKGERWYEIRNVDEIPPFFISVISNVDHWMFISSTGGLTAGRVSPDTALFPYVTVDKIHESTSHTGSKTIVRVHSDARNKEWEPFNREQNGRYPIARNLYKNRLGNKLCFEEVNHELELAFRYTWVTSEEFGFSRQCELQNLSKEAVDIDLLDGLQNILPAGTPRFAQTNTSNLVDAYKWSELDPATGLALFTLYSGITDRAEPCESLKANTVFCLGLAGKKILISSAQVDRFRAGAMPDQETRTRGVRGAYFASARLRLESADTEHWQIVADIEQTQNQVVGLQKLLGDPANVVEQIERTVAAGSDELAKIMARADGFQATEETSVSVHHYANVLFNVLRGGIFDDQYKISAWDFCATVRNFNRGAYQRNQAFLQELPEELDLLDLLSRLKKHGDAQLGRLGHEYLPITFGRRHGDPSRPWNQFAIRLKDKHGNRLLSYEGNWRDIFQNWEALALSYPEFVENMIAKFVNASTIDGYNPYRITKDGIDWEVEEPDDPWSYIGYWGDHQIIYLQKLLELSRHFHPDRLDELLHEPLFTYANVPYRIRPFAALLKNPKQTVDYDEALAQKIEHRVSTMGADGKLLLDASGEVYQVTLLEKLLIPLLSKLGNLVVDGGIWMNTQRPEWNDANNALVGQGLSMVTLCYLRRYVRFLQEMLADYSTAVEISAEVGRWLTETAAALREIRPLLGTAPIDAKLRFQALTALGNSASQYRSDVYARESFSGQVTLSPQTLSELLTDALAAIDHSIGTNRRSDGLYHAYNLLRLQGDTVDVDVLYPMLEGQVAVLSAGAIPPAEAVEVVEALFASDVYRPDQHSFMLYPDRDLPAFLDKNRIPEADIKDISLAQSMLASGDERIVTRDADGSFRFNADLTNVGQLNAVLDAISSDSGEEYSNEVENARAALQTLYEKVFQHQAFTGRSGGMFGFEGLGSIYWHMVAKLLLAVQENFFAALDQDSETVVRQRIAELYYRIREGIGFNKTPAEYGAFPTDPYSHTPKHAGARQPGMTGQVKEEILTRFGELGVRVSEGAVRFQPSLLRPREFVTQARKFRYLDVSDDWQEIDLPAGALAFTWCQIPVIYRLDNGTEKSLVTDRADGETHKSSELTLSEARSRECFQRSGQIRRITVTFGREALQPSSGS